MNTFWHLLDMPRLTTTVQVGFHFQCERCNVCACVTYPCWYNFVEVARGPKGLCSALNISLQGRATVLALEIHTDKWMAYGTALAAEGALARSYKRVKGSHFLTWQHIHTTDLYKLHEEHRKCTHLTAVVELVEALGRFFWAILTTASWQMNALGVAGTQEEDGLPVEHFFLNRSLAASWCRKNPLSSYRVLKQVGRIWFDGAATFSGSKIVYIIILVANSIFTQKNTTSGFL